MRCCQRERYCNLSVSVRRGAIGERDGAGGGRERQPASASEVWVDELRGGTAIEHQYRRCTIDGTSELEKVGWLRANSTQMQLRRRRGRGGRCYGRSSRGGRRGVVTRRISQCLAKHLLEWVEREGYSRYRNRCEAAASRGRAWGSGGRCGGGGRVVSCGFRAGGEHSDALGRVRGVSCRVRGRIRDRGRVRDSVEGGVGIG